MKESEYGNVMSWHYSSMLFTGLRITDVLSITVIKRNGETIYDGQTARLYNDKRYDILQSDVKECQTIGDPIPSLYVMELV